MTTTHRQVAEALYAALEEAQEGKERDVIRRLTQELLRQGSLSSMDGIIEAFSVVAREQREGRPGFIAEVAHEVTVPDADVSVVPELLGGARLTKGDVVVDASISGRLADLRSILMAKP